MYNYHHWSTGLYDAPQKSRSQNKEVKIEGDGLGEKQWQRCKASTVEMQTTTDVKRNSLTKNTRAEAGEPGDDRASSYWSHVVATSIFVSGRHCTAS